MFIKFKYDLCNDKYVKLRYDVIGINKDLLHVDELPILTYFIYNYLRNVNV